MIEFILIATLSVPAQPAAPATTYSPPRPVYTPPVNSGGIVIPPSPAPQYTPPPSPTPAGRSWSDKMWERYKNQSGGK